MKGKFREKKMKGPRLPTSAMARAATGECTLWTGQDRWIDASESSFNSKGDFLHNWDWLNQEQAAEERRENTEPTKPEGYAWVSPPNNSSALMGIKNKGQQGLPWWSSA